MDSPALVVVVVACICYVVARIICTDMRTPRDTFEDDLQQLIRKHDEEINKRRRPVRENHMGKLHWWEFAGIAVVILIALPLTFGYDGLAGLSLLLNPISIVAVGIGVFIWVMLKRDVVSWAFLARMHRIGVLYLVVPFSFILLLNLLWLANSPLLVRVIGAPVILKLEFVDRAAILLSTPLLFAVLNPSGIVRGLAAASLGLALASIGTQIVLPSYEFRFVGGQEALWGGLPEGSIISGLILIPAGAALVHAGYRGRWSIPVRVTRNRRAFVLVMGTALVVWALWGIFSGEDVWIAVAVALAFTCAGLLMQRYQWPRLPLLFGVTVGSLIEVNFIDAMARHDLPGALVQPCPIALAAMVLALAVLSYRLRRSGAPSGETRPPGFRLPALLQWRNVVPVLGVAVGAAFWWGSLGFENATAWFMPRVAGLAVMAFCLLELLSSTRDKEPRSNASPTDDARGTLAV